ncbi:MAG: hypothetical protein NW201_01690 [Gemmatimonadales bacterium]|nr:hypothetical protein [Gemmatimonadales bacterium]
MSGHPPGTVLCLASYVKGADFLREMKAQGWRVLLLTIERHRDAAWPREAIDEIHFGPERGGAFLRDETLDGVSWLARREKLDRIVPLDDLDLEIAATLREHLRLPGMGESTTRRFRDKLAMRQAAHTAGILVPDFTPVFHDATLADWMARVPAPWVLKPRSWAGSIGVRKVHSADEVWHLLGEAGDQRASYLLERFVPGDVFHVDSIVFGGRIRFARASGYLNPPLDVVQGGGIFMTRLLPPGLQREELLALNEQLLDTMGLVLGASHTEFIRAHEDGRLYFLETSGRVGGAHISDLIEQATGVNLWREWAKTEIAGERGAYTEPHAPANAAGLLVSLARQEWPDTSAFDDPETIWHLRKKWHVGFVVRSDSFERVDALLHGYAERVRADFHATMPPQSRPTE